MVIKSYEDVRKIVERPRSLWPEFFIMKKDMLKPCKPKRYHLKAVQLERLIRQGKETGNFPNPFRKGVYGAIIDILSHWSELKLSLSILSAEVCCNLGEQVNCKKENKNDVFCLKSSKFSDQNESVDKRLLYAIRNLQRVSPLLHCPGEPLRQLGASIHTSYCDGVWLIKLDI